MSRTFFVTRLSISTLVILLNWAFTSPASAQLVPLTPEHKELAILEGKWDFELETPDGTKSKGNSEYLLTCGGLWLVSEFHSDMGGQPFEGRGIDGYDPVKKKFTTVWVDSFSMAPMVFEGTKNDKGHLVMTCNSNAPDGSPAVWRSVTIVKDKDHHSFEMYLKPQGGEEMKMMTIQYIRGTHSDKK